ncbi:outer membrane protein [[Pasteurella] aerogenes]|nr:outer membrane protein [[Pasteurella] aerogenes]
MNKQLFSKTLIASLFTFSASSVFASAFQLAEISSSGLGRAYAGEAAIADNASVVATNPALMSLFKSAQFSNGGILIDSNIDMDGTVTAYAAGVDIAKGSTTADNVIPKAVVPHLYYVQPIDDKFAFGAGMNVNFGLKSEYDADYDAGVFGGTTDLTTINLNLSGSYRVSQGLSLGAGVNAIYARAEIERTAGVLATGVRNLATNPELRQEVVNNVIALEKAGKLPAGTSAKLGAVGGLAGRVNESTVLTHLEDKTAWAFGWNLGAVYEVNERNRFGLAYHSKIDIDFKDRSALSLQQTETGIGTYVGNGGLTLHLPEYVEFSGFHQLTDKFAMHYSYKWTRWSRLQDLDAKYNDGRQAFRKEEKYRDNSRIALGATYNVDDKLTLRAGIAYDEVAAPQIHASAAIPDTDRTWYSLGATYKFTPNLSVDFAYAHLRGKKLNFKETQSAAGGLVNVVGDYKSTATANLYGISMNYSF